MDAEEDNPPIWSIPSRACSHCLGIRSVFLHSLVQQRWLVGLGGHTTEMLRLMCQMDLDFYTPRIYVVADTDKHSAAKSASFEQERHRKRTFLRMLPSPRCLGDRRECRISGGNHSAQP